VNDLPKLRAFAQRLANDWHEPALLILEPPDTEVNHETRIGAYVALLSGTNSRERAAKHERFEPKGAN
jgi:hypothetical protein